MKQKNKYETCKRCGRDIAYNQWRKHIGYCESIPKPIEVARMWVAHPTWSEIDLVRALGRDRGTSADRAHLAQGMYELRGWTEEETRADMTQRAADRAKNNKKRSPYDDRFEPDWTKLKRCGCCEILIERDGDELCDECAGITPVMVRSLPEGGTLAWYIISDVIGEKIRNRKRAGKSGLSRVRVRKYRQRLSEAVLI